MGLRKLLGIETVTVKETTVKEVYERVKEPAVKTDEYSEILLRIQRRIEEISSNLEETNRRIEKLEKTPIKKRVSFIERVKQFLRWRRGR